MTSARVRLQRAVASRRSAISRSWRACASSSEAIAESSATNSAWSASVDDATGGIGERLELALLLESPSGLLSKKLRAGEVEMVVLPVVGAVALDASMGPRGSCDESRFSVRCVSEGDAFE